MTPNPGLFGRAFSWDSVCVPPSIQVLAVHTAVLLIPSVKRLPGDTQFPTNAHIALSGIAVLQAMDLLPLCES